MSVTSDPPLLWDAQLTHPSYPDVDLAGLSFYSLGFDKSINQPPRTDLFQTGFTPFYNLFSPKSSSASDNRLKLTSTLPLIIAQTSASQNPT